MQSTSSTLVRNYTPLYPTLDWKEQLLSLGPGLRYIWRERISPNIHENKILCVVSAFFLAFALYVVNPWLIGASLLLGVYFVLLRKPNHTFIVKMDFDKDMGALPGDGWQEVSLPLRYNDWLHEWKSRIPGSVAHIFQPTSLLKDQFCYKEVLTPGTLNGSMARAFRDWGPRVQIGQLQISQEESRAVVILRLENELTGVRELYYTSLPTRVADHETFQISAGHIIDPKRHVYTATTAGVPNMTAQEWYNQVIRDLGHEWSLLPRAANT